MKHSNKDWLAGEPADIGRAPEEGRRRLLRAMAALPAIALVPGCELPVPGQGPPPDLYLLSPKSTFREDLPQANWQLIVEPPTANASLNSTRIALLRTPTKIDYYARSNWGDRAPLMVQTLILESFENTGKIVSIGKESVGLRADFILKTDLREMQTIYYEGGPPKAWVGINAKLVIMPRRSIVANALFQHRVQAKADSMPDIIEAFDEALNKVLRRLVEWVLIEGDKVISRGRPRLKPNS